MVRSIDGKDFDQEAFYEVLMAAIDDRRYDMDWPFATRLGVSLKLREEFGRNYAGFSITE